MCYGGDVKYMSAIFWKQLTLLCFASENPCICPSTDICFTNGNVVNHCIIKYFLDTIFKRKKLSEVYPSICLSPLDTQVRSITLPSIQANLFTPRSWTQHCNEWESGFPNSWTSSELSEDDMFELHRCYTSVIKQVFIFLFFAKWIYKIMFISYRIYFISSKAHCQVLRICPPIGPNPFFWGLYFNSIHVAHSLFALFSILSQPLWVTKGWT